MKYGASNSSRGRPFGLSAYRYIGGFLAVLAIGVLGLSLFLRTSDVQAAQTIPYKVNFQGRLTTNAGAPVADGLYNLQFRIYDASSSGNQLWIETRETTNRVQVTSGLFSVQLGDVSSLSPTLFATSNPRYFEITMATPATANCSTASCATWESPMSPRQPLGASVYAFNADTIDGIDGADLAQLSASNTFSGTNTFQNTMTISGANNASKFVVQDAGSATVLGVNTSTQTVSVANLNVGAGNYISLVGGATNTRPASPTEGMLYFDSTTKQLLTYANGKWQADRSTSTKIVAANDSPNKEAADYVVSAADETAGNADAAINAALAALPAGGGTVYLMEGTYTIDTTIALTTGDILEGAGHGTIIKLKNGINANINAVSVSGLSPNQYRVAVRNMLLEGNKANNTSGAQYGINTIYVANNENDGLEVDKVTIQNFRSNGILFDSFSRNSRVTDCVITGNSSNGIYINGSTNNINISGNTFKSNTGSAVDVRGARNMVIGNYFESNTGGGITTLNASNIVVSSNTFVSNGASGVDLWGSYGTVSGNTIKSAGSYGIRLFQSDGAAVTSNDIESSTQHGIYISSSTRNTISDNNIKSSLFDGISLTQFSDNNNINDNYIYNSGGTGSYNGIALESTFGSDNNTISGNRIIDTAGTGYAISIFGSVNDNTLLSGNSYSGTGASSIFDSGTNTAYNSQSTGGGDLVVKSSANMAVGTTTASASLTLQGGFKAISMSAPATPTVTRFGTAGTTTYTYAITATDGVGETLLSTAASTTTGNATLSASNYNRVSWTKISSAVSYKIYRTASGGTPSSLGLIGTVNSSATAMQFDDTGIAGTTAAPTTNTTGGSSVQGTANSSALAVTSTSATSQLVVIKASAAHSGELLQIQRSDATPIFTVAGQGAISARNWTDSSAAFQIQNAAGSAIFTVNSSSARIEIANGSDIHFAGVGNTRNAITKTFTCTSTEAVTDIVIVTGSGTVGRAPGGSASNTSAVGVVVAKPSATECTIAISGVVVVNFGGGTATIGDSVVTSGTPGTAMGTSTPAGGADIGKVISAKDGFNLVTILLR